MRQIVLDTETTGLSPQQGHRIIEIGCVELSHRRLTGKTFHIYLQPDREIESGAIQVHGITNEFLKDKPRFDEIAQAFKVFIQGADLIVHNAPFDLGFIENEFLLLKDKAWRCESDHCAIIDTLSIARQKHPGQRNNLDALCKRYGVDNTQREKHGALLDAQILAYVYLAMTGGQDALVWAEETLPAFEEERLDSLAAYSTIVIKATEEEMAAHIAFLDEMEKSGTKSAWRELEE